MTEVLSNEHGNNASGDELSASGGNESSFEIRPRRKSSISSKNFCNQNFS